MPWVYSFCLISSNHHLCLLSPPDIQPALKDDRRLLQRSEQFDYRSCRRFLSIPFSFYFITRTRMCEWKDRARTCDVNDGHWQMSVDLCVISLSVFCINKKVNMNKNMLASEWMSETYFYTLLSVFVSIMMKYDENLNVLRLPTAASVSAHSQWWELKQHSSEFIARREISSKAHKSKIKSHFSWHDFYCRIFFPTVVAALTWPRLGLRIALKIIKELSNSLTGSWQATHQERKWFKRGNSAIGPEETAETEERSAHTCHEINQVLLLHSLFLFYFCATRVCLQLLLRDLQSFTGNCRNEIQSMHACSLLMLWFMAEHLGAHENIN